MKTAAIIAIGLFVAHGASAFQQVEANVHFELVGDPIECILDKISNIDFGTVSVTTTVGEASIDPVDGTSAASIGVTISGAEPGKVRVSGVGVNTFLGAILSSTMSLANDQGDVIPFRYTWAKSYSSTDNYVEITGLSTVENSSTPQYYRFGGRVTDVGPTFPAGKYTGTLGMQVSCLP